MLTETERTMSVIHKWECRITFFFFSALQIVSNINSEHFSSNWKWKGKKKGGMREGINWESDKTSCCYDHPKVCMENGIVGGSVLNKQH